MIERIAKIMNVDPLDVEIIRRLPGGRSHHTFLFRVHDQLYVYRKIGKDGNRFVNRNLEYEGLKLVEKQNLTPKVIYFNRRTGKKVTLYLEGETCARKECSTHMNRIAERLHQLHDIKAPAIFDIDPVKQLDLYESLTGQTSDQYRCIKKWWVDTYQIKRADAPKVFCHNDVQKDNVLISDNEVYFLDFEFVGKHEYYHDIASFGNEHLDDAFQLLDAYLKREATLEEKNLVRFYRIHQALKWHQVALRKEQSGLGKTLGIDFKKIADDFIKLADLLYQQIKG